MCPDSIDDTNDGAAVTRAPEGRRFNFGAGLASSVVLHGLALAAFILMLNAAATPNDVPLVVPVNIVALADATAGPLQPDKAAVPQQTAGPTSAPAAKSADIVPVKQPPPPDELEIKLHKLAQLRQPILDTPAAQKGEGLARIATMREDAAPGSHATIKDFLRDQIERHWSPDLSTLKGRNISVLIRVAITNAGVVSKAEVVNSPELGMDPSYDEIARSARNAALLSSPITLPPGHYAPTMDVILKLDTKDALR